MNTTEAALPEESKPVFDNPVIKTYPEMNAKVVDLLRIGGEFKDLYAAQRIEELEAENAALKEKLENQTLEEINCNAAIFLTAKALDEQTTKVECHTLGNVSAEPVLQGLFDLIGMVQQSIANFDMVPQEETQEKVRQAVLKYLEDATESRR